MRAKCHIKNIVNGPVRRYVVEMSGEETEMDRSMVERIEEPLVHMVRNAISYNFV